MQIAMNREILAKELRFKTSRSGGAGGQNVNKVETKVALLWDLNLSEAFDEVEKERLRKKLANRISKDGLLQLESSVERSQLKNKEIVTERFFELLIQALKVDKKRIATKTPRAVILNRLDRKKKQSLKKQARRKFDAD